MKPKEPDQIQISKRIKWKNSRHSLKSKSLGTSMSSDFKEISKKTKGRINPLNFKDERKWGGTKAKSAK